jgi:Low-density lipoprotein receptor domain class A
VLIRSCKISEFPCKGSSLCLPLDKYCDGIDHCGDLSDEPKFCSGESMTKALNSTMNFNQLFRIFLSSLNSL